MLGIIINIAKNNFWSNKDLAKYAYTKLIIIDDIIENIPLISILFSEFILGKNIFIDTMKK